MRRLLTILCFLLIGFISKAQFPHTQTIGNTSTLVKAKGGLGADSTVVFISAYADTTAANLGFIDAIPGAVIRTSDDNLWMRNNTASAWVKVIISGAGSGITVTNTGGSPSVAATTIRFATEDFTVTSPGGGVAAIAGWVHVKADENLLVGSGNEFANVTIGNQNVGVGNNVFDNLTSGVNNVVVGYNSFTRLTTVGKAVAVGNNVFPRTTTGAGIATLGTIGIGENIGKWNANENIFIGFNSFQTSIDSATAASGAASVYDNIGIGWEMMQVLRKGIDNVGVGFANFDALDSGSYNNGFGQFALQFLVSGENNDALGWKAGYGLVGGNQNIMIGNESGWGADAYMNSSIFIGARARYTGQTNLFNVIVIGDSALVGNQDNIAVLGRSGTFLAVGRETATEQIHIDGAILLGAAAATTDGTIQWTGTDFEGRKGGAWVSLTAGGDVTKVGTPANNQLGVWTGDGTIEGDANLTFASSTLNIGVAGASTGILTVSGSSSGTITIQPAAAAGTWTMTLPTTDGDADQVLKTDGNGVTSWTTTGMISSGTTGKPAYYTASTTLDDFIAVNYATSGTHVKITSQATTDVPLEVKAIASQTAALFNVSSSSGTGNYFQIAGDGAVGIGMAASSPHSLMIKGTGGGAFQYAIYAENSGGSAIFAVENNARINVFNGGTLQFGSSTTMNATGTTVNFFDANVYLKDNSDDTKIIKFEASSITTGTTRTYTMPNLNGTVALVETVYKQGADVASAAGAIALGSDGNAFEITGTSAITLISNVGWQNGSLVTLAFTSTATLTDGTANSGTDIGMELAGNTNFVASAGATVTLRLMEIGGTQRWREISRSVN